jgi:alpha-L-fucosidase
LIVPNHHGAPLPGEDVQTFEQDLPGANTAGFNTTTIGNLPLETSLTMNNSWGFNITDTAWKSVPQIIGYLVRAAGSNANLLLNIGPRPDGTIQPEAAERLRVVGEWLQTYGTSIYNTRGGPIPPRTWGVTTQRGDSVFVHILDWRDRIIAIPLVGAHVIRASMLGSTVAVNFEQTSRGVTLTLPDSATGPDRVIVVRLR